MEAFNYPEMNWPTGAIALVVLPALAIVLTLISRHFYKGHQAKEVSNFLEDMANPEIVSYDNFWAFLRDFEFWDGKQFQLEGKFGHGIASPEAVARVLARVLVENPYLRYEVASALCVFYFTPRAPITKDQGSLRGMANGILDCINRESDRGSRIWHDFSRLIEMKILELEKIRQPAEPVEKIDPDYVKAYKLAKKLLLAPKKVWGVQILPAKADASAKKPSAK